LVEEKLNKENNDKHKLDKIYKAMKIKNFAKAINDNIKPHVNEDKRVELELRIDKLKNSKKYIPHHHKRKPRILLKKIERDSARSAKPSKSRSQSAKSKRKDHSKHKESFLQKSTLSIKCSRSRSAGKKQSKKKENSFAKSSRLS